MTFNILEDIRPVTELKARTREVFEQLHRTGRPIVITVNGKPDAVLMDAREFQRWQQTVRLAELLAEAEDDVAAGRLRPAGEVLDELLPDEA